MLVIPFALVVAGYWVMWAGVKQTSLLDAWNCVANPRQAPISEPSPAPGTPTPQPPSQGNPVANPVSAKCTVQAGDNKLPLPGGHYVIVRPAGVGLAGIVASQVIVC